MILTTEQTMKAFGIARSTTMEIFATKGSPAFKIGTGRGHWRVDEKKFEDFLLKRSGEYKG